MCYDISDGDVVPEVNLLLNQAEYGGALYVDDDSETAVCSSNPASPNISGCFFQLLKNTSGLLINFFNNSANHGQNLFGGLLDRCTADSGTDISVPNGVAHFEQVSNIKNFDTITSKPVRAVSYTHLTLPTTPYV